MQKRIETPKTEAGVRSIPMIQEVFDAFLAEYQIQKCLGFCEEEIDGYSGFVFSTAYHTVYSATSVNNAIHRATKAYNNKEKEDAKKERREPALLPNFSAHHLRHTFCTRLCENETNLKVIMSIMGHADISTTMDIYAECTQEKKARSNDKYRGMYYNKITKYRGVFLVYNVSNGLYGPKWIRLDKFVQKSSIPIST